MRLRESRLITAREVHERIRAHAFAISTTLLVVIVAALIVVPKIVGDDGGTDFTVGVAPGTPAEVGNALTRVGDAADVSITVRVVEPRQAPGLLEDGDIDAYLRTSGGTEGVVAAVHTKLDDALRPPLTAALAQVRLVTALRETGLTAPQIEAALRPVDLHVDPQDPEPPGRSANRAIAIIGVIALYLIILTYGNAVASGVLEEKSNKVVEVLLATVRPTELLAGKVTGVGAVGLAQVVIVAAAAGVAALATGGDIPQGATSSVVALVVWLLLGYAFYALLYAAAGSLVSRQEDLSSATIPITFLILLAYLLGFTASTSGDSGLTRIISFIPPFAPFVMPVRATNGDAAAWEIVVSMALLVAAIAGMNLVAARIYTGAVNRIGERVKLRVAFAGGRDLAPPPVREPDTTTSRSDTAA